MKNFFYLILLFVVAVSCDKISNEQKESLFGGEGVFLLNEGNFLWGNGSLSFYSYDSSKIYNNLFRNINERPLGDVPNSMSIIDDKIYIVVNNSGKIEVINKYSMESLATINGLISPRSISFVSTEKAYITSIYSDSVAILNLPDNSISGYINIRRSSESIIIVDNKAFVSNWVGGNEVMVINTVNNKVIDSIEVGVEPESMVIDKNKHIWVLCNGGWARNNFAHIIAINSLTNEIVKDIIFSEITASPSCLRIDGKGENIYYLENGVHCMSIDDASLPANPLISQSGHYFYKLGLNPDNSDIFVTDAVDYQQAGYLLYYKKDGTFVSEKTADIIPSSMEFQIGL